MGVRVNSSTRALLIATLFGALLMTSSCGRQSPSESAAWIDCDGRPLVLPSDGTQTLVASAMLQRSASRATLEVPDRLGELPVYHVVEVGGAWGTVPVDANPLSVVLDVSGNRARLVRAEPASASSLIASPPAQVPLAAEVAVSSLDSLYLPTPRQTSDSPWIDLEGGQGECSGWIDGGMSALWVGDEDVVAFRVILASPDRLGGSSCTSFVVLFCQADTEVTTPEGVTTARELNLDGAYGDGLDAKASFRQIDGVWWISELTVGAPAEAR